jgi:hypothetical protein
MFCNSCTETCKTNLTVTAKTHKTLQALKKCIHPSVSLSLRSYLHYNRFGGASIWIVTSFIVTASQCEQKYISHWITHKTRCDCSVSYFGLISAAVSSSVCIVSDGLMIDKYERKRRWHKWGYIPEISWKNWGRPCSTSLTTKSRSRK